MSESATDRTQSLVWYTSLVSLKPLMDDNKWKELHQASKNLVKQLYAKAPTAKIHFETVVLLSMGEMTPQKKKTIIVAYNKSIVAAQEEMSTPDYDRIVKEEQIADQLSVINTHISTSWRIIWNYWRGDKAKDLISWKALKTELEETPMTRYGRLRLMARHGNVGQRITPSFMKMVLQLWPLAAMCGVKKAGPLIISIIFKKQVEKRKARQKMKSIVSASLGGGFNVGSLKKSTGKRKSKRRKRS